MNSIDLKHSQLNKADEMSGAWSFNDKNFSCHLWTKQMLFVVATYDGKLLLLNYSGELVEIVANSP